MYMYVCTCTYIQYTCTVHVCSSDARAHSRVMTLIIQLCLLWYEIATCTLKRNHTRSIRYLRGREDRMGCVSCRKENFSGISREVMERKLLHIQAILGHQFP